jgi:HAMP domain-containing protein
MAQFPGFDMAVNYKSMGIASKLMVAPLLVAVLLLAFGIFSFANMRSFQNNVNGMLDNAVAIERNAMEAESTVNATHAAAYRSLALLNLRSEKAAQSAEKMMTEQLAAIAELGQEIETSPNESIRGLLKPLQAYELAVRDAYDSATSDPNLGAMMMQDADKSFDALTELLDKVQAASRIASNNAHTELNERIDLLQLIQMAALLFAMAAGLVLAYFAGQKIANPLRAMQAQITAIEQKADFSLRVKVESQDEVGKASASLNGLLQSLQSAVQEVNSVVSAVSAGDFSRRVDAPLKGDMAVMKKAVNDSAESIMLTMNGLNDLMHALQRGQFAKQVNLNVAGEFQRAMTQATEAMTALNSMMSDVGKVMQGEDTSGQMTSIGSLSPNNPANLALNKLPLPRGVTFHSIIGDRGKGDTPNSSDGIVPYWSSHVTPVASEKIVSSNHGVPDNADAAVELKRILKLHLGSK